MTDDESTDRVSELATELLPHADADLLGVYSQINEALVVAFGKTNVDSGTGGTWCDFWVRHGGIEYKLEMKPHRSLGKPS